MENSYVLIDKNELLKLQNAAQRAEAVAIHYVKTLAGLMQHQKTEAEFEAEIAIIQKRVAEEWAANDNSPYSAHQQDTDE